MEKLSKQDESRIMRAMEKTADLVKAGSKPSAAVLQVVKSAEYGEFTPQMVQRIVEATNTAMQLAHLKTASGEARTESIPLAEPKAIFEELYPSKVESPAVKAAAAVVPACYFKPETGGFMKVARPLPTRESVPMYGADPEIRAHRTMSIHGGLCKKAEAARSAYGRQREKVYMLAKAAATYFKRLDRKPFADVERYVVSEYGAIGKAAMDTVFKLTNGREKRAVLSETPLVYNRDIYPYALFSSLIEEAQASVKLAEEAEAAKMEKERHETEFVDKIRPKKTPKDPEKHSILESDQPVSAELKAAAARGGNDSSFFSKAAFDLDLSSKMIEGGTSALGLGESKPVNLEALRKVMDPEHEAEMRGIKTKAMLHDFMSSDPIISSYDTEKITNAFNQVSQLAPNVSQQPAVMRGVMRKILQQEGVLEPFETDQLTKLERQLTPSSKDVPAEAGRDIGQLG
jgi:hypothetical protein